MPPFSHCFMLTKYVALVIVSVKDTLKHIPKLDFNFHIKYFKKPLGKS